MNPIAGNTKACTAHKDHWTRHIVRFGRSTVLGIRRLLRRSQEEVLSWNPARRTRAAEPAHDADGEPILPARKNYFTAGRYYCVETMCKPCGMCLGWDKFFRSESPTQIVAMLKRFFPRPSLRPTYVVIDKGCLVLKRIVNGGDWREWSRTTRFIVDSYHYINHRATDFLCRTWCNPAPMNGQAPNLVKRQQDARGDWHYTRAFNTQASSAGCDCWIVTRNLH